MIKIAILFLILSITAMGCSATHQITPDNKDQMQQEIESASTEHNASIHFKNREYIEAAFITFSADSLSWTNPKTTSTESAHLNRISHITIRDTRAGGKRGFWIGGAIGLALASYDPLINRPGDEVATLLFFITAPALIGVVGGTSALIGLSEGKQITYNLQETSNRKED